MTFSMSIVGLNRLSPYVSNVWKAEQADTSPRDRLQVLMVICCGSPWKVVARQIPEMVARSWIRFSSAARRLIEGDRPISK